MTLGSYLISPSLRFSHLENGNNYSAISQTCQEDKNKVMPGKAYNIDLDIGGILHDGTTLAALNIDIGIAFGVYTD